MYEKDLTDESLMLRRGRDQSDEWQIGTILASWRAMQPRECCRIGKMDLADVISADSGDVARLVMKVIMHDMLNTTD